MLKLKSPTLALSLLFFTTAVQAEVKRYNIDILIFENSTNRYVDSEQWPVIIRQDESISSSGRTPGALSNDDFPSELIIELKHKPDTELVEQTSKAAEYPDNNNVTHNSSDTLADYASKLKRSSQYNILLHQSWQQTGLNDTDAISIQINSTDTDSFGKKKVPLFNSNNNKKPHSNIQGSLKLILGRYLHIHTDLHYKRLKPTHKLTSSPVINNVYSEFQIKSHRRMRSNEIHYIDHPLLGILIKVSPIKKLEKLEKLEKL